jgi:hypothetical protein
MIVKIKEYEIEISIVGSTNIKSREWLTNGISFSPGLEKPKYKQRYEGWMASSLKVRLQMVGQR